MEGLAEIFVEAGCAFNTPSCGACMGGHMGVMCKGERCVSTFANSLASNEFKYLAGIITSVSTLSPYFKTLPFAFIIYLLLPFNIGFPILECAEAVDGIDEGDHVVVDFDSGMIYNLTKNTEYKSQPFPTNRS